MKEKHKHSNINITSILIFMYFHLCLICSIIEDDPSEFVFVRIIRVDSHTISVEK